MLDDIIKRIIKAKMSGDKKEEKRLYDYFCKDGSTYQDYLIYEKIYKNGRIKRIDVWNELDDTAINLYERFRKTKNINDLYECYEYCAPCIRIWLSIEVENLIQKGKYNEAYRLLCKSYSEVLVKRIQKQIETKEERDLLFNKDRIWIMNGPELFDRYFLFKENSVQPLQEFYSTLDEIKRMYRVQKK